MRYAVILLIVILLIAGCSNEEPVNETEPVAAETQVIEVPLNETPINESPINETADNEQIKEIRPREPPKAEMPEPKKSENTTIPVNNKYKVFNLTADNSYFYWNEVEEPELIVNVGDTVHINLIQKAGIHDLIIPDLRLSTAEVTYEQRVASIEFTVNQTGNHSFYCGVSTHSYKVMGTLIVLP